MVSCPFNRRILVDYDFLKYLLTNYDQKGKVITQLLRVNNNSKHHKKQHVVILKSDFDKLVSENIIKEGNLLDLLKGCTYRYEFEESILKLLNDLNFDDLGKRSVLSVILSGEHPYEVVLLTIKENFDNYNKDNFFEKIKDVDIKDFEEGLVIISSLFSEWVNGKDLYR